MYACVFLRGLRPGVEAVYGWYVRDSLLPPRLGITPKENNIAQ